MKFDIYGRFELDVVREGDRWLVYRLAPGKRLPVTDFIIPAELQPGDIATFLDDLFHESAAPGKSVRLLA